MKNLTKVVSAKVNGVTVNKTVKVATVEKTVKVAKIKVVSNYKENVIVANQKLNTERNSLGAYLDLLQKYKFVLCKEFQAILTAVNSEDKELSKLSYDTLKSVVKTTKNGKYNQFYTLQGMQKICFPK